MKNKDRIAILNKRVDTLYEWVAYIQKHTQAGINSGEKLHLDPNGDNISVYPNDIDSVVKKNFTTDSNVQNLHKGMFIEVPFRIDKLGEIVMQRQSSEYDLMTVCGYCYDHNIDQTRIKRIWLEMKSEEE